MYYLGSRIQVQFERSAEPSLKIVAQCQSAQWPESQTREIRLHEETTGKYVVLPLGSLKLDRGGYPALPRGQGPTGQR